MSTKCIWWCFAIDKTTCRFLLINCYILLSGCGESFVVPTTISVAEVKCTLSADCSRIDCCVDYSFFSMKLHFFFYLDQCNYVITGGIESKNFTKNILSFQWGKNGEKANLGYLNETFQGSCFGSYDDYILSF